MTYCLRVYRDFADAPSVLLGTTEFHPDNGWRFVPNVSGRRPRQWWSTLDDCIPRWAKTGSTSHVWTVYAGEKVTDPKFRATPPVFNTMWAARQQDRTLATPA